MLRCSLLQISAASLSAAYVTSAISFHSQQASINEKKRQRRYRRKNNKNTTINLILPFAIPNLGPAARNGDGEESTDKRQRETKRRSRKHDDPEGLTVPLVITKNVVVFFVSL